MQGQEEVLRGLVQSHAIPLDNWRHRWVVLLIHEVHYQLDLSLAAFHNINHVQPLKMCLTLDPGKFPLWLFTGHLCNFFCLLFLLYFWRLWLSRFTHLWLLRCCKPTPEALGLLEEAACHALKLFLIHIFHIICGFVHDGGRLGLEGTWVLYNFKRDKAAPQKDQVTGVKAAIELCNELIRRS